MITGLVRLCVFRVCLLIRVALWCLVTTPGASGQLPEFTGEKNTNASRLLSNAWLPNQFQMPFACQTYQQTVLQLLFSSDTRNILINLKMLRDMFSSTQSYNDDSLFCCKVRSFHTLVGSNQTQCLVSCTKFLFYPTNTGKLQDTAIKVSTSPTYWNSFPDLCPLSLWKILTTYVFTAINLECACQMHFAVPVQIL